MANVTYTVKKGDTLYSIANTYNTTVDNLVKLNGIKDKNKIAVGQVLVISGTATTTPKNTSNKAIIEVFGLQSDTDRTVYATWKWDKDNTENYKTMWYYSTGDGVWFVGSDSDSEYKQSTYTAPSNATSVKFKVKPVSKKYTKNKKEYSYWTADWSTEKKYSFSDNPPTKPPVPTVTIDGYKLEAELDNLDVNATTIEFQVYKNDKTKFVTGFVLIKTKAANFSCDVDAGGSYKVRCRAVRDEEYSDWTEFSNEVLSAPAAITGFTKIKAVSSTEVQLDWDGIKNVDEYEVQWSTKKRYFDSSPDNVQSKTITAGEASSAEITGLEPGQEYFFRVRVKRGDQYSAWCEIASIVVGKTPSAPTTWSSRTTVTSGEPVMLYWVHNAEDGSKQTEAFLEITINGETHGEFFYSNVGEEEVEPTYNKLIDTTPYVEGTKIQWRVKTKGITDQFSEFSAQRTIDVYAPPTLAMSATNAAGDEIGTIKSFPFYIRATAGPSTQKVLDYHVSIVSTDKYETVDEIGNVKIVNKGEAVYSKHINGSHDLRLEMSAGNVDFINNMQYRIKCVVSMDSGLTAEAEDSILVLWDDEYYTPNASIYIDPKSLTASIGPYCRDENENLIDGVLLSVYRREFNGSFIELATGIRNTGYTYITDPHPALDYARYRIVATAEDTGTVSYYDMPGEPVNEKAIIIQWNEQWSTFDLTNEDEREDQSWSGSLLRLPYNIDVSDSTKPDVALIEYIGREHPVSYYGTQLGSTSTWNVVIPKSDKETLYTLRRLSIWMGDVYVREPSGSGYWANINVSFSQKHRDLTIPVTLNITRVAGGA